MFPITWEYTWQHGRQLASMSKTGTIWNYTYNADGLRTQRTNGANTYSYIYNGGQLSQMTAGNNTLNFTYDANGTPLTVTHNGTTYYYATNLQGDVISITDQTGAVVVTYTYDAWGNLLSTTGTMASTLGAVNPLRYRGYVYDNETGLYYLQSRYYNPEIGRFINADGQISGIGGDVLGYNMFAYCFNNPVNMSDDSGNWPKLLKEIGARLTHAVKIMTKIITSPLKATTVEVGGGVGYGASAKVVALGLPVEVGASATITDSYVYDKGTHDLKNTTSVEAGVNLLSVVNVSSSVGESHSYFDEQCNCSFWNSTFGEKTDCLANKDYITSNATFGISAGLYMAIGFEFSLSFDFKAWGDELISIYHESLSFEGYY